MSDLKARQPAGDEGIEEKRTGERRMRGAKNRCVRYRCSGYLQAAGRRRQNDVPEHEDTTVVEELVPANDPSLCGTL